MEVVPPAKSEKRQRRQLLAKLGTEDKADKRSRPAQARDLRRNRDHTAKAAMADRTKTIDACLGVIYACENYGECCGGGGQLIQGRGRPGRRSGPSDLETHQSIRFS